MLHTKRMLKPNRRNLENFKMKDDVVRVYHIEVPTMNETTNLLAIRITEFRVEIIFTQTRTSQRRVGRLITVKIKLIRRAVVLQQK